MRIEGKTTETEINNMFFKYMSNEFLKEGSAGLRDLPSIIYWQGKVDIPLKN